MISYRILLLNLIIIVVGVPVIAFLWFMPFNFFVDIDYVHHQDTCSDQPFQTIITVRDVKWKDEYHGSVHEQLFRYDGDEKVETTIHREVPVIWQKDDGIVVIEVEWNKDLPVGSYGAYTIAEIDAGFKKVEIRDEDEQRFVVKECKK